MSFVQKGPLIFPSLGFTCLFAGALLGGWCGGKRGSETRLCQCALVISGKRLAGGGSSALAEVTVFTGMSC